MVKTQEITLDTAGDGDIIDITDRIEREVIESGLTSGTVTAFIPGSTAALTTIEHEPGLLQDLPEFFEKLIPAKATYNHDRTWHDGNGYAHLRSALVGPDITIPFIDGRLQLGTWQQVVFLEFDNRKRHRKVLLQIIGE